MAKAQTGDGNHHMRCPVTTNPPHKHQSPEQYPYTTSPPRSKRQKLNNIESAHWDNLSNVWFTKSALRELDRRNQCQRSSQNRRPLTRQFHAELRKKPREPFQFAPDFRSPLTWKHLYAGCPRSGMLEIRQSKKGMNLLS